MSKNSNKLNTIALLVIWAMYCVSLMLPSLATANGDEFGGLSILLIGWMGLLAGKVYAAGWYANLFFFYISVQTMRGKSTHISHIFMLLLTVTAFMRIVMPLNENGDTSVVTERNLGFYLWFSSIVLLSALGFINRTFRRNRNKKENIT
ncbi:hypothetical protein ACFQPF_09675 [Fictibacillus iocasae]|uniref:Uncharacterized protein n=1 Tax=Fictibacillus iocasae TaxID=2715437 RepID=A0ABW2NSJ3_9BACL